MNTNTILFIIFTFILIFIGFILPMLLKRPLLKQLMEYIDTNQFDAFYKKLDSFVCKYAYRPYDIEIYRLNGLIAQDDLDKVTKQVSLILNMRIKDTKKAAALNTVFYYYLQHEDLKQCSFIVHQLKDLGFRDSSHQLDMMVSILLKKESKYINEMKGEIRRLKANDSYDNAQVGMFEYLVGIQYMFDNRKDNARNYLSEAKKHLVNTPYEEEVNQLLSKLN